MKSQILIISVILLGITLSNCSKKVVEEIIRPVTVIEVLKPGETNVRRFSGLSKADDELDLSFRISGTVNDIAVNVGDKVKKGQLIARLESTDQDLEVKRQQANIAQTNANLKQAKNDYERSLLLYEANNISKSELDSAEASYLSTKAQLSANKRSLELARQEYRYCYLYSPDEGFISESHLSDHQVVNAGTLVAVLQVKGPIEVEFGVAESMINKFQIGQYANVKFDFIEDKVFKAKVNQVSVSTNDSTTYPVKVSLIDFDQRIRPGMVCDVEVEFESLSNEQYIVVPSAAVVGDVSGDNYVWLFDEDTQSPIKRIVKVGSIVSEGLQITNGLSGGEKIITRGVNTLEEGMKVRLL